MKNQISKLLPVIIIISLATMVGCGGQESGSNSETEDSANGTELTDFQLEHGIGPVTEPIKLEDIDPALAEKGAQLFETKCSACHKMDSRYVGPPLGGITDTRTPAFIMNMILNPEEMVDKHPIGQALLQEYMTPMANQNLSREEARAIVAYLASDMAE
ncbi:c-type cytochrome [Fodinibius sediminis]|uniref:Cytochrome c n=1 Tax=Fodinibius sediminis TaxID=1214077 RepID=A0A521BMU8_9BACT|nr:cytochrome c [Fodinibius sediminis]SMO48453.1 Cytochrome c [Fodinibius sediminis]